MARGYFRPSGVRRYTSGGRTRYVRRVVRVTRPTVRRLGAFRSIGAYAGYRRPKYSARRR